MKLRDLDVEQLDDPSEVPFDVEEAQFLIGYAFRLALRDVLFASQRRENLGIVQSNLWLMRRGPAYREIMGYSYYDYFEKFLTPCLAKHKPGMTRESLVQDADLRSRSAALAANPRCRVVNNRNDFLASDSDVSWLESVFDAERLRVFSEGGHMGNLHEKRVQQAILDALVNLSGEPRYDPGSASEERVAVGALN